LAFNRGSTMIRSMKSSTTVAMLYTPHRRSYSERHLWSLHRDHHPLPACRRGSGAQRQPGRLECVIRLSREGAEPGGCLEDVRGDNHGHQRSTAVQPRSRREQGIRG
jgi:hypothetical protein